MSHPLQYSLSISFVVRSSYMLIFFVLKGWATPWPWIYSIWMRNSHCGKAVSIWCFSDFQSLKLFLVSSSIILMMTSYWVQGCFLLAIVVLDQSYATGAVIDPLEDKENRWLYREIGFPCSPLISQRRNSTSRGPTRGFLLPPPAVAVTCSGEQDSGKKPIRSSSARLEALSCAFNLTCSVDSA